MGRLRGMGETGEGWGEGAGVYEYDWDGPGEGEAGWINVVWANPSVLPQLLQQLGQSNPQPLQVNRLDGETGEGWERETEEDGGRDRGVWVWLGGTRGGRGWVGINMVWANPSVLSQLLQQLGQSNPQLLQVNRLHGETKRDWGGDQGG